LEAVVAALRDNQIARYANIATLALLAYDYLLTFEDERRLIWQTKWSVTKAIFIANRYTPFIGIIGLVYVLVGFPAGDPHCKSAFLAASSFIFLSYVVTEFILYLRAYAVWGCTRKILAVCILSLTLIYTTMLYYSIRFITSLSVINNVPSILHTGCIRLPQNKQDLSSFIILVCSEAFALLLLAMKAGRRNQSKILRTMFRDGVLYFFLIILASLVNIFILKFTPASLNSFLLPMQSLLHSIFCSRLMLSIKRLACNDSTLASSTHKEDDTELQTGAGIEFDVLSRNTITIGTVVSGTEDV